MGCSSTPGESRECSTSTQRERAPRVPMRLARGKSAVRHRSRCARPHRRSPSPQSKATQTCRALAGQSLPTTVCWRFVVMSLVLSEVVVWWPSGISRVVCNSNPVVCNPRLADQPIPCVAENVLKQGAGRSMHLPTSLARRRVHAHTENRNYGFRRSRRTTRRPKMNPPCAN